MRGYDYIIIKQADKGSAVVISDRDKYVAEAIHGSCLIVRFIFVHIHA